MAADRRQRRADHDEPALVRPVHELPQPVDQLLGADLVARVRGVRAAEEIVDPLHDDDVRHAGLGEDVAVEAGERARAGGRGEDAVAADPRVDDGERRAPRRREAPREAVRAVRAPGTIRGFRTRSLASLARWSLGAIRERPAPPASPHRLFPFN